MLPLLSFSGFGIMLTLCLGAKKKNKAKFLILAIILFVLGFICIIKQHNIN